MDKIKPQGLNWAFGKTWETKLAIHSIYNVIQEMYHACPTHLHHLVFKDKLELPTCKANILSRPHRMAKCFGWSAKAFGHPMSIYILNKYVVGWSIFLSKVVHALLLYQCTDSHNMCIFVISDNDARGPYWKFCTIAKSLAY